MFKTGDKNNMFKTAMQIFFTAEILILFVANRDKFLVGVDCSSDFV